MNTPIVALMCSMPSCQSNLCSIFYCFDIGNRVLQTATCKRLIVIVVSYCCKCEWRVLLSVSLEKKDDTLQNYSGKPHQQLQSLLYSFIYYFYYLYFNVVFCDYGILSNNCDFLSCAVVSKVQMMMICVNTKVNKLK